MSIQSDFVARVREEFAAFPDYKILTNLEDPSLTPGAKISYLCICGEVKERFIHDVKKGCSDCTRLNVLRQNAIKKENKNLNTFNGPIPSDYFWKTPNINEYADPKLDELWRHYPNSDTWISNKGRIVNVRGNSNIAINNHKVNLVFNGSRRTGVTMFKLVCNLFDKEKAKLLDDPTNVGQLIDKEKGYTPDNITVISKGDLSRQVFENEQVSYLEERDLPSNLRNVPKGTIPELPDHWIFSNGLIYNRKISRGCNRLIVGSSARSVTERKTLRITTNNTDRTYYIDILMLMVFSPITGKNHYDDYKDIQILYKNNNVDDCVIDNITYKHKDLSHTARREQANIERINLLQGKILESMKSRKATLLVDLKTITNGEQNFPYKCGCGVTFNRCFNDLNGKEGCLECENLILIDNTPSDQKIIVEIDGVKQEFARCDCGWVSANYIFLNNKLQQVAIKKDQIYLGRVARNPRRQLAIAFKVANYERLGEKGWIVALKNSDYPVSLSNIEVITQSELSRRITMQKEIPEGLDPIEKDENIIKEVTNVSIDNALEKTHPEFTKISFFSNGVIKSKSGLTKGRLRRDGYLDCCYNKKSYKVHRLICFVFNPIEGLDKIEDYIDLQVDHINGIKHDNSASNLRWTTQSENIQNGVRLNSFKANKPINMYELTSEKGKGVFIKKFDTQKECVQELNMSATTILSVLRGDIPQRRYFLERA